MYTRNSIWLWAFTAATALEIWGEAAQNQSLIFCTKPLLMPLLLIWFVRETAGSGSRLRTCFIVGLIFSTLGDVLLMLRHDSPDSPNFFLAGVGAFLVAQISYTIGFGSKPVFSGSFLQKNPVWLLPFVGYLVFMFWFLPGLRAFPLWIYALAITAMALSAVNLRGWVAEQAWRWAVAGALIFVASDSILACGLFGKNLPFDRVLVMLTYVFGQYLLVRGARRMI